MQHYFFIICFLGTLSVSFCQTEYYVDAEKGNDLPTYGPKTNPWKTLTYAISLSKEVQAIIYLKKDQSFSDLASKMDVTKNLTIKCWTDEETISLSESYSTILLNSSNVSFWVTASLTFDGIRFQKLDNVPAATLINMNSSTTLLFKNVEIGNYSCDGIETFISSESESSIYMENTRFYGLNFNSTSLIKFMGNDFYMKGVIMKNCTFTGSSAFNLNASFSFNLGNSTFESNTLYDNPLFLLTTETKELIKIDSVNVINNTGTSLNATSTRWERNISISMAVFLTLNSKSSEMSLTNSTFERNSVYNGTSGMLITGRQFKASCISSIFILHNFIYYIDCNFTNNRDSYFLNWIYQNPVGTGVLTIYSLNVDLNNLNFVSNSHAEGGALFVNNTGNFSLVNSTIQDNKASRGGGLMLILNAKGEINNVNFSKNNANRGGAIFVIDTENLLLANSTLQDNQGKSRGGALLIENATTVEINNVNLLKNNVSRDGGDGGAIYIINTTNISLSNANLQDNQAESGSALYIKNGTGKVNNVSLLKNTASLNGGAICVIYTENFSLVNSTLQDNQATQSGGAVYTQNAIVEINNVSLLKNNVLTYGGALYFMDTENFSLVNSTLQDNQAESGGAVYMWNATGGINNVNLLKNTASLNGGALYVIDTENFSLVNSTFQDNQAARSGGAVYIQNAPGGINNVSLLKNTASLNGGAICVIYTENFSLVNSTLQDNQAAQSGGAVYTQNATLEIYNVSLLKNNVSDDGGAIYVINTKNFSLMNATLQDNQAKSGGAIYVKNGAGEINNVSLVKNNASDYGGAIYVIDTENFSLVNAALQDNQAQRGGALYIKNAPGKINNVNLSKNTASLNGGAIYVIATRKFSFMRSTLQDNQAAKFGGALYIESVTGQMNDVNLSKNTASEYGGAIYVIDTKNFSLMNATLQENQAKYGGAIYVENGAGEINNVSLVKNNASEYGGAMYVINTTNFSLVNAKLQDNQAKIGGALLLQNATGELNNVDLLNNRASLGGAIHVINTTNFSLVNTKLQYNQAQRGGALFIQNGTGELNNVDLLNNIASFDGGAIHIINTANFSLVNAKLQYNQAERGGGLYIANATGEINNVNLSKNTATYGGGLYADADKLQNGTFMISNSKFEQNIGSLTGGGAHLDGIHIFILKTKFLNNSVNVSEGNTSSFASSSKGGAIFYSCEDFKCSPEFTGLEVRSNSAEVGGAMYFNNHVFDPTKSNTFIDNSAKKYGNTFASYPIQIFTAKEMYNDTNNNTMIRVSFEDGKVISNDDFIQRFFIYNLTDSEHWKRFTGQTTNGSYPRMSLEIKYVNQTAGLPLSQKLSFYTLDCFAQQIAVDNSTYSLKSIPLNDTISDATRLDNTIEVKSANGEFIFHRFFSSQGTNINLNIQTNITCMLLDSTRIKINIEYRQCRIGETLPYQSEVCTTCPPNSYSLSPPVNSSVLCKTCDKMDGLMCKEGGSKLTVGPGFWRSNSLSLNVIKCFNPAACAPTAPDISSCSNPDQLKPGIIETTCNSISNIDDIKALNIYCTNQTTLQEVLEYCKLMQNGTERGYCNRKKGYKGVLCTECIENWGKSRNYECVQCTLTTFFFLLMTLTGLFKIGLIAYTVYQARGDRKYQVHSTMLKIFITFFQIESLLFSVPMYWPPFVDEARIYLISFFSSGLNPGGYSYDCILPDWLSHFEYNALYAFFAPIIWTVATGVILLIRKFVFKSKMSWETAQDILKITSLVTYFYFWPDMITNVFSTWNIMDIGAKGASEWRLVPDPTIEWFSRSHISFYPLAWQL